MKINVPLQETGLRIVFKHKILIKKESIPYCFQSFSVIEL